MSKVNICNQALAAIGEASIRDFDEGNKRARMCDRFYEATRAYLLAQFDWPFARRQKALNKLAEPLDWVPDGVFTYAVPADCHQPIDLWPEGSLTEWEIRGRELHCTLDSEKTPVVLMYIQNVTDPSKFSAQFVNLLSVALAVRICLPLTQDKELTKTLFQQYTVEKTDAWATDAAMGNRHLANNENPALDSFVDADFSLTAFRTGEYS